MIRVLLQTFNRQLLVPHVLSRLQAMVLHFNLRLLQLNRRLRLVVLTVHWVDAHFFVDHWYLSCTSLVADYCTFESATLTAFERNCFLLLQSLVLGVCVCGWFSYLFKVDSVVLAWSHWLDHLLSYLNRLPLSARFNLRIPIKHFKNSVNFAFRIIGEYFCIFHKVGHLFVSCCWVTGEWSGLISFPQMLLLCLWVVYKRSTLVISSLGSGSRF